MFIDHEPLGPQGADRLIETTKAEFRFLFGHPLLPRFVGQLLTPALEEVQILSDEEFGKACKESSNIKGYEFEDLELAPLIEGINAVWTNPGSGESKIAIKRRLLEEDRSIGYFFRDLMAEQLAYPLRIRREIPLIFVEEGSLIISPFNTPEGVLKHLQEVKKKYYGDTPIFADSVVCSVSGFSTTFTERADILRRYPITGLQRLLEASRSAIIQTIFEALLYGAMTDPRASGVDQYRLGIGILSSNASVLGRMYGREIAGLNFLSSYLDINRLRFGLTELFESLYRDTVDEFYSKLSEGQKDAFEIALEVVDDFQKGINILTEEQSRSNTSRYSPN